MPDGNSLPSNTIEPFTFQLERNTFTGVANELTVCLMTSGNNVNTYAAVNWEEVT